MAKDDPIRAYIASEPPAVQKELKALYGILKKAAPRSGEKLAWGMPTLHQEGNLVHFCAFKNHMSVFPGGGTIAEFKKELGALNTSKGTIQFVYGTKLPAALLTRIVKHNLKANLDKAKAKAARKKPGKKTAVAKKKR